MVQKVLLTVLVLLWTMPLFMVKHNMKAKYITKQKVNYREDKIFNKPLSCTELVCKEYQTNKDGTIDLSRSKQDTGIQYKWQQKDEIKGFIPKPVAQTEYGTVYQHQGMLLENLHRSYLYMVIRLPKFKDLEQGIPTFPNCDNYGIQRSLNPNPTSDNVKLNDNALHQQVCTHFKVDYLEEMDIIQQTKRQIAQKINENLLALFPNKIIQTSKELVTATGTKGQLHFGSREKRAIPVMVILQAGAAIGGTLIKGINALVDAKSVKSFNNAIKMVTANVELTHQRLMTLGNRTSMMTKAIIPPLDDLKSRITNMNQKLTSQYRMMQMAHHRYNLLLRQMHETLTIHQFALLLFKNYLTIQVGTLQRIHRQYNRSVFWILHPSYFGSKDSYLGI